MNHAALLAFLRESLMIEGILRDPTEQEMLTTKGFLLGPLDVNALLTLQAVYAPGMPLRFRIGDNVRVGDYVAPPGGPTMLAQMQAIVARGGDPWVRHVEFEMLHPFFDGNGRTGRALWAHLMLTAGENPFALPFLHRFYYQTLASMCERPEAKP